MSLGELSDRRAVVAAIDEYRRMGRDAFLAKYKSRGRFRYFVLYEGDRYESKPIAAAAYGFQYGAPLPTADFNGGNATVKRKLESLRFKIVVDPGRGRQELKAGAVYSWSELGRRFGFKPNYLSVAGGMIPAPDEQALLLMTHPGGAKSFDYADYWEAGDLIYTGRGQRGDQQRLGPNRQVGENEAELYVFEPGSEARTLVFIGTATCVDEWTAAAPDREGRERTVLQFRLRFGREVARAATEQQHAHATGGRVPVLRRPRAFDAEKSPKPATAKGSKVSPEETLALREKARQGHHELLRELSKWLASTGWSGIEEIPAAVDLWATRHGRRVLFEAKTLGADRVARVRGALAQLLEYRYFYGSNDDGLCVVTDRPVAERRCRMLDALGVAVLWRDGETFRPGSRAGAELIGEADAKS